MLVEATGFPVRGIGSNHSSPTCGCPRCSSESQNKSSSALLLKRPWKQATTKREMQAKQKKASEQPINPLPPSSLSTNPSPWVSSQGIGMSLPCAPRLCYCSGWLRQRQQLDWICPNITLPCSHPEVTGRDHVLPGAVKILLWLPAWWCWKEESCLRITPSSCWESCVLKTSATLVSLLDTLTWIYPYYSLQPKAVSGVIPILQLRPIRG